MSLFSTFRKVTHVLYFSFRAMQSFDTDDDDRISFSEFLDRCWKEDDKRDEFEKLFRQFRNRLLEVAQKSNIRNLFESFTDGSDRLNSKEFFDCLHDFGIRLTKSERQNLWEEFDLSHDSYISLDEFHDALTFPRTAKDYEAERAVKKAVGKLLYKISDKKDCDPEDVLEDLFDDMDEDHDGKVEVSEFGTTRKGKLARALYRCMRDIPEMQKRRIFYRIDSSGEGTIGMKELKEFIGE